MAETYTHHSAGLESPASHGFDIVPDDNNPLPSATRAIFRATRVFSTRTTATDLVGLN